MFPRIHYVSRFGPLGSHARDSPFQQSASAASLNWRQESRFRIVISEGGFRSRNPLCLFRKPASEHSRLHPVYVGESFVGSRNCLPVFGGSSRLALTFNHATISRRRSSNCLSAIPHRKQEDGHA